MKTNIPVKNLKEPNALDESLFAVKDLTLLLQEQDLEQELHRHNFYTLLVIEKGSGQHPIDFVDYEIKNHTVFLLRPGQVHQLSVNKGAKAFVIQFKNDFLYTHNNAAQNHLTKLIQHNIYNLESEGFQRIQNLVSELIKEYTNKTKGYQEVLKAYLSILLIELLRQRQEKTTPTKANPYAQEKLELFLELVEKNATQNKQVTQYADWLHLSTFQLNNITKTLLGKTPSEIINEFIILEAKRQLLATSAQVSQIAYDLGYEDTSYFIRFFKKHTNASPEVFRQNFK